MAFIATLAFTCHLLAANLIQRWEMFPDQLPHDGRRYAAIFVPEHVADGRHLRPRDVRMPRFYVLRQLTAGFRDDLNAAFHQPLFLPILIEGLQRNVAHHGTDPLDCLDDVGQA
jgi:hypothetical protein